MKILYFDIDGTILRGDEGEVKTALGAGAFEVAIRDAGIERLVCVGNFGAIASGMKVLEIEYDTLGVLFRLCGGAFRDEAWLRARTIVIDDPQRRADHIDFTGDWWYADDLAPYYLRQSGRAELLERHLGGRILTPEPSGDGRDVLEWLRRSAG